MALLVLEDQQGLAPRGPVDAQPGDVAALALGLLPDIVQTAEFATLEKTFSGVGHAPFHLGLVLGMTDPRRVGDEAAALGVFHEVPGEGGMQGVRSRHRGRAIVDDQVAGGAAEVGLGRLQPGDDVLRPLADGGPDEAVPGVGQHHDQDPHGAAPARVRIVDQAQAAEVHLHHLTRQDDCKVGQDGLQREGDERGECVDMGAAESLFQCLEQVPDPRRARGVRHPFQAILRLTLLGLVCGQTTMAHIALFARMHWPALREPLGFLRDHPPHATTISRTLAGVPCEQLQSALTGWVARVVADQELDASVDGKWAKQSEDAQGNPLVMVNVLAHDLKLCLAQWPASEKRYEPGVLREQLGRLFEDYPGLRLLTMDALYAERDLCQAIVDHGRDYLVRVKGNQPTVLAALTDGFAPEELGEPQAETLEKSGCDREAADLDR